VPGTPHASIQRVRLSVILNSARGDARAIATNFEEICRARAVELHVCICPGAQLKTATSDALDRQSTHIVAGGGDGTISTVASVLVGTDATLGVLPLGTLNHFARDLHIPLHVDQAIDTIFEGDVTRVDVGDVNGRTFINNSSVGLYPRLVWEREQRERQGHGKHTAMVAAAWTVWRHYRRVKVAIANGRGNPATVRTPFVFVGNNRYELSGLAFGSRPALDAGRLHVCMAPGLSAVGVLHVLAATLRGRLVSFEQFESLETAALTIGARRSHLGVALDGEIAVLRTPLRYRSRPAALRVIVPRQPD
jgi:diacylglycerol kinase family enzyme